MFSKTLIRVLAAGLILASSGILAVFAHSAPYGGDGRPRKPTLADTVRLNVYADNWFDLYINGERIAVDSIRFLPHNVVAVDVLPEYPMHIAVMARDNADPETGMEYANTNIGDGGFILKLGDGTVTSAAWKVQVVSRGPLNGDVSNPRVEQSPIPDNWFLPDFDDSGWSAATEYGEEAIGPKDVFHDYDFDGARFIWSRDVRLDNTVLFRHTAIRPPDGVERADFRGINALPLGPTGGRRR